MLNWHACTNLCVCEPRVCNNNRNNVIRDVRQSNHTVSSKNAWCYIHSFQFGLNRSLSINVQEIWNFLISVCTPTLLLLLMFIFTRLWDANGDWWRQLVCACTQESDIKKNQYKSDLGPTVKVAQMWFEKILFGLLTLLKNLNVSHFGPFQRLMGM